MKIITILLVVLVIGCAIAIANGTGTDLIGVIKNFNFDFLMGSK